MFDDETISFPRKPKASRKALIRIVAAAVGLSLITSAVEAEPLRVASTNQSCFRQIDCDLRDVTVSKLQEFYRQRRYTVTQVISWHLDRIRKFNPSRKALIYVYADEALAEAARQDAAPRRARRGPLWGVPVVIKNNTSMAGKIITNGWNGFARPGMELIATRDATVVRKLRDAGAIIVGHSNLPDLADSDTNTSSVAGRTGNAYAPAFSPGGSSGGTAVAVALNMAVLGQGTDTGNSIRNPASNASLVGFVPTHGLVSMTGIHPNDVFFDNSGPLTRTVRDAAIALDVMAGADPSDPRTTASAGRRPKGSYTGFLKRGSLKGRRFGVPYFMLEGTPSLRPNPQYWHNGVSPETRAMFMKALEQLRAAGAMIVLEPELLPEAFDGISSSFKTKPYRAEGINRFLSEFAPTALSSLDRIAETTGISFPLNNLTAGTPQRQYETDPQFGKNYLEPRHKLITMYQAALKEWRLDAFVYPALQVPANDERVPLPSDYPSDGPYSATGWVNRLGIPAIVVPAGFYANGLPFGIEIAGDLWEDGQLLGYAYAFERATNARHPPPSD